MTSNSLNAGIASALGAAILFGAGTPFAKLLLDAVDPWLLAGILYLGSGIGLAIMRRARSAPPVGLARQDAGWLAGAVLSGGIVGPVLLMWGLAGTPASTASLLLNAEGVFTALVAWFVFRENFDRRIALGMACIVTGAIMLAWQPDFLSTNETPIAWPAIGILGACLAWAIDSNLTRNGAALGFFSYGISLVLFVVALRHLGTARTGAYFSVAPFVGAIMAVLFLNEAINLALVLAAALMGFGLWLHLTERHVHEHTHEAMEHEHEHDTHHQHPHDEVVAPGVRHRHRHRHEAMMHSHEHYPDAHHRHRH